MCGIVGILGKGPVSGTMLDALKRLEYRGYDSAGIATLVDGKIERRRCKGKLTNLANKLRDEPLAGQTGIGHTRWATHGAPTEQNAHPHATDKVAVVHNGIIENFRELRLTLEASGQACSTETDSEIIALLLTDYLNKGLPPIKAVQEAIKQLEGAFAIGIIFKGENDLMVAVRQGSPLAIGLGDGEMYIGSDAFVLAPFTKRIIYLEDGDWAEIRREKLIIRNADGQVVDREEKTTSLATTLVDKGNHKHFMAKEIFEQPEVIGHTLGAYIDPLNLSITIPKVDFDLALVPKITIAACGTAYYAGMIAKYWFEKIARLSVEVDIASEFRYREAALPKGGLALFISQSGETADTLAALRYCRDQNQHIASIINVEESSIARESDIVFPTHAGPEIGVASTKAFTCQLTVLACLVIAIGRARGSVSRDDEIRLIRSLMEVPRHAADILNQEAEISVLAHDLSKASDVLYMGRGAQYPIALEGALKLKEISYIHAEGYAAGELKHGPIALVDEDMPVIIIAPSNAMFDKTVSNMQEVIARGGKVILISDEKGIKAAGDGVFATLQIPYTDPFVAPILNAIPVQLLAYYTAVAKGTDVDQPRNLAKSVTVE
ncbi:MAG: glutamine--fructose-6-phosphate transaminase (isomerizing) [Alphaproteobacteria bacterium]|nr:MAG: glutamine--fructose-6-phosphate transaminase (isomerizing) [Alphaproteobacteria bacterium]